MDQEIAQQNMYNLINEIDRYRNQIKLLDIQLEICYQQKVKLLKEFPTLQFRRPGYYESSGS
jgi:hypothetical protein